MPRLCLDLDVMERNAGYMSQQIRETGKLWRPHVKSHCQPRIAQTMVALGAAGVTAASVAEAEVMCEAGIPSVLLAHLVVDPIQIDRLVRIAQKCELLLIIDHFVHAERLSERAKTAGVTMNVLVDIDIGMHRTGVRPGTDATRLAVAAAQLPSIHVAGIMGYEGHLLQIKDAEEKKDQIFEAMNVLQHSRDRIREAGLTCDIVSAGGTGSFQVTRHHEAITELQAGGGIFGDLFYTEACTTTGLDRALWVEAEVVSRPSLEQAVINCGRKALSPEVYQPRLLDTPGSTLKSLSAEHAVILLDGTARDLSIGDPVRFALGYSDLTLLLHRMIHVYRGESKVDEWPVIRPA